MMRPMCGSSSATRMWFTLVRESGMSDQGCDVAAVSTHIEEKPAEVRGGPQEHEEKGIVGKRRDDCVTFLVLEDRGVERTMHRCSAERFGFVNESGNARREVFVIEARRGEAFDQEA